MGNGSGEDGGWGILAGGEGEEFDRLVPNSDFAITDNTCFANVKGGISLDPTMPADQGVKEAIWAQRAKVSGNVCSNAKRYHGIQITHASEVLVIGNECAHNPRSGIQLVDSAFVRLEANTCRYNLTGIRESVNGCVEGAGHNLIRNNTLKDNMYDDVVRTKTDECQR